MLHRTVEWGQSLLIVSRLKHLQQGNVSLAHAVVGHSAADIIRESGHFCGSLLSLTEVLILSLACAGCNRSNLAGAVPKLRLGSWKVFFIRDFLALGRYLHAQSLPKCRKVK